MDIKNIYAAKILINRLEKVNKSIEQSEDIINCLIDPNAEKSKSWSWLSEHKDGSGWSIDLFGTVTADTYIKAVISILKIEKSKLELELTDL